MKTRFQSDLNSLRLEDGAFQNSMQKKCKSAAPGIKIKCHKIQCPIYDSMRVNLTWPVVFCECSLCES